MILQPTQIEAGQPASRGAGAIVRVIQSAVLLFVLAVLVQSASASTVQHEAGEVDRTQPVAADPSAKAGAGSGPGESQIVKRCRFDREGNPPGPRAGRGTNWENPLGPRGGPGAGSDRGMGGRPIRLGAEPSDNADAIRTKAVFERERAWSTARKSRRPGAKILESTGPRKTRADFSSRPARRCGPNPGRAPNGRE